MLGRTGRTVTDRAESDMITSPADLFRWIGGYRPALSGALKLTQATRNRRTPEQKNGENGKQRSGREKETRALRVLPETATAEKNLCEKKQRRAVLSKEMSGKSLDLCPRTSPNQTFGVGSFHWHEEEASSSRQRL